MKQSQKINVVLGGGGMKGIGLVGAMAGMEDAGYTFNVLAGCSAGAIVAALKASGMSIAQMGVMMDELDYTSLLDTRRLAGRLGVAAQGLSVVRRAAANSGENLHGWLEATLALQGVRTFGDLKNDDPALPPEYRYNLVVVAADLTHGRLLRLPWDYHLLGLDPDKQSVAKAIRAATALPLLYEPVKIGGSTMVDGGIVSNYPVGVFRELQKYSERTIGVRLSFAPEVRELERNNILGLANLAKAMLITSINAQAEEMMHDPEIKRNTILVDVDDVKVTDFQISKAKQKKLYDNGYIAAQQFISKS
jgi:NTE family protein